MDNFFEGPLPWKFSNLSKLKELLGKNRFPGPIPQDIGLVSNVRIVEMYMNFLEGAVPFSVGKPRSLQKLDLHSNKLTTIPSEIGLCTNLTFLSLAPNTFSGALPSSLGNLIKIINFGCFSYNHIRQNLAIFLFQLDRIEVNCNFKPFYSLEKFLDKLANQPTSVSFICTLVVSQILFLPKLEL